MILILIPDLRRRNRVIRADLEYLESQDQPYLLSSVRDVSILLDGSGQAKLHHPDHGEISPSVVFYWVSRMPSSLEAMELNGYRLINPVQAWKVGCDKALQLSLFEKNGIPHPWTLLTYAGARSVLDLTWKAAEYVFKPHRGGRGTGVQKADNRSRAEALVRNTIRYREGLLIQEYLNHEPKPRHHYRVNIVGLEPVSGVRLEVDSSSWVTNQARGGRGTVRGPEEFPREAVDLAVRAAAAVGADYSGVDVIEGPDEAFYVLEANELPALGESTALYLASHILKTSRRMGERHPAV